MIPHVPSAVIWHPGELLAVACFVGLVGTVYVASGWCAWRRLRRRPIVRGWLQPRWRRRAVHALAGLGTACIGWGWAIEADALALTRPTLAVTGWRTSPAPLQILHLTDLHLEGRARRVERLLALGDTVAPHLVCFTGDYLNDPQSAPLLQEVGATLRGAAGAFAVNGNWDRGAPEPRAAAALAAAGVRVLHNERVAVPTVVGTTQVVGIDYPAQSGWQRLVTEAPPDDPMIVLYHAPDLVEDLAALRRPCLYLCGHTHGGQIRLPIYGALITLAYHGKKYEMGPYQVGDVTLYVNRGVGLEAGHAPRVRFWCPPEAALISVVAR